MLPSILFAAGHAYQATNVMELGGVFAITSIGSVILCWFYKRWNYNLWIIVALHGAMNLWWEVSAVDDTALGGWLANGARLTTIVLAIILTIYKDRRWSPIPATSAVTFDDQRHDFEVRDDSSVRLVPSIT